MTPRAIWIVLVLALAAGCASLSGYDASKYESSSNSPAASVDPETAPLPKTKRQHMLDPRSPLTIDASDAATGASTTNATNTTSK